MTIVLFLWVVWLGLVLSVAGPMLPPRARRVLTSLLVGGVAIVAALAGSLLLPVLGHPVAIGSAFVLGAALWAVRRPD